MVTVINGHGPLVVVGKVYGLALDQYFLKIRFSIVVVSIKQLVYVVLVSRGS